MRVLCILAMGGCDASDALPHPGRLLRTVPGITSERIDTATTGNIELLATIGDSDGSGSFGRIGAAIVDPLTGALLVTDVASCEVRVLSLQARAELGRFGRCGEGPGEFRLIGGLHVSTAGIGVVDDGGRRLELFARDGSHLRSSRFAEGGPFGIYRILAIQDSAIVGLGMPPFVETLGAAPTRDHAVVIRRVGDGSEQRGSVFQPATADSVRAFIGLTGCAQRDPSGRGHIVVMSTWAVDKVIVDGVTLVPLRQLTTQVSWARSTVPTSPGVADYRIAGVNAACGQDKFATLVRAELDSDSIAKSRLEVWSYGGELIAARNLIGDAARSFGKVVGMTGDTLMIAQENAAGAPILGMYRVSP